MKIQPVRACSLAGGSTTFPWKVPSAAKADAWSKSTPISNWVGRYHMDSVMREGRLAYRYSAQTMTMWPVQFVVLRVNGLPERYPKPVEVTDDELSHAIERI